MGIIVLLVIVYIMWVVFIGMADSVSKFINYSVQRKDLDDDSANWDDFK